MTASFCFHCGEELAHINAWCPRCCPGEGGWPQMSEVEDDYDQCPTCKGEGTVNPLTAPKDFFCAGVADCPHCDGTGRL
jgi:DnaJ-class molecular chaperone